MDLEFTNHSAAAQTCFNNLTHGLCAHNLFVFEENPAEFKKLVDSYFEIYRPATDDHAGLVLDLAHARWMLWRRQRALGDRENALYGGCLPANWDAGFHRLLDLMDRYKTQGERAFQRALSNVRTVKKDAENSTRWRAHLAVAQQRVQVAAEKHEAFIAAKQQRLEESRRKEEARRLKKGSPPPPPESVVKPNNNESVSGEPASPTAEGDASAFTSEVRP